MARYALEAEIVQETPKAVLIQTDSGSNLRGDDEMWLPKSQIGTIDTGEVFGPQFAGREMITFPGWLIRDMPHGMKEAVIKLEAK